MKGIISRPYASPADFHKVRNLLITTYSLNAPGVNWEIRRWDGKHFHNDDLSWQPHWEQTRRLWETDSGELVGVVNPEYIGNFYVQIHPDYRELENEMIAWAETACATGVPPVVETFTFDHDAPRNHVLKARGYTRQDSTGMLRRMRVGNRHLPVVTRAEGYVIRGTSLADAAGLAALLNAGFNRTIHNEAELTNFMNFSPSFRHELNLVAEAADGTLAAHVGVTIDPSLRYGIFEPVVTHPDHRRKGLAQTLMIEGMHRAKVAGAGEMLVDTGDDPGANAFYDSMGFAEAYLGHYWKKTIQTGA